MKLDVRDEGDVTVITLSGSLVIGSPEQVVNDAVTHLLLNGRDRLVLDVGAVKRVDSSGIETLLSVRHRACEQGGDARLAHVPPTIQTLLEIAGLTAILQTYPSVAAAV